MVLTYTDLPSVFTSAYEQLEFVRHGAMIEHSYYTVFKGETSWQTLLEQINSVGFEHIFLSSDMGQATSPTLMMA